MSMIVNPYSAGSVGDPQFSNVQLLCHCDGSNGSSTFTNVVYPTRGQLIGRVGGTLPTVTTSNPLFGTGSVSLGNGAITSTSISGEYTVGTSVDFAAELAFRTATPSQTGVLLETKNGSSLGFQLAVVSSAIHVFIWNPSVNTNVVNAGTVLTNTWQRLSWCRVSGVSRCFLDGAQIGSNYTDTNDYGVLALRYGSAFNDGAPFSGQQDELRLTIGAGRHSSNYTVDAVPFADS